MLLHIVKNKLLDDAGVAVVVLDRELAAVVLVDDLPDPCVDREGFDAVQSEQEHAVGDLIADAVDKSGLRGVLCYEVTDRDGVDKANAGINENVRFLKRLASNPNPRLAATFGLHASLTLSGATLQACRAAVADL